MFAGRWSSRSDRPDRATKRDRDKPSRVNGANAPIARGERLARSRSLLRKDGGFNEGIIRSCIRKNLYTGESLYAT